MHGGLWTGAQVVVNKVFALLGTLALMYLLVPEQFGVASVALSIQALLNALPAFTLSDVLLSDPKRCAVLLPRATRICAVVTAFTSAIIVVGSYAAARHFAQPGLETAGWIMALRPIADLLLFGPQTLWRAHLGFRHMARIDAVSQVASTVMSVAMAYAGAGFASILLPPILFTAVRAAWYGTPGKSVASEPADRSNAPLWKPYFLSGLGQYVHGGLIMIPPILIAQFSDEVHAGWFSAAFSLSASTNSVVAVSIGLVLQPIFAQMSGDRKRQIRAFVRACSAIAAVAMPVCLLQAVLIGPSFRLALPERWGGAIQMAAVMSVGQAFYFAVNPAMGLLKAQGRFSAFFVWQSVQLAFVTAGMLAARAIPGKDPALAIVGVYGLYHLLASPVGVALCVRGAVGRVAAIREVFLRPGLSAIIAILPASIALELLPPGAPGDVARIVVVPIIALVTYPAILRRVAPATYGECMHMLAVVSRGRLGRLEAAAD